MDKKAVYSSQSVFITVSSNPCSLHMEGLHESPIFVPRLLSQEYMFLTEGNGRVPILCKTPGTTPRTTKPKFQNS